MSNDQHMIHDVDKELQEHGIKENAYLESDQLLGHLINELETDPAFEKYKEEFTRLQQAFNLGSANEKKLIKHYKDLRKEFTDLNRMYAKEKNSVQELLNEKDALQKRLKEKSEKDQLVKEEKIKEAAAIAKAELSHISAEKIQQNEYTTDENEIELIQKEKDELKKQLDLQKENYEKLSVDYNMLLKAKVKIEEQLVKAHDAYNQLKDANDKSVKDADWNRREVSEKMEEIGRLKKNKEEIEKLMIEQKEDSIKKENKIIDITKKYNEIKLELDSQKEKNQRMEKTTSMLISESNQLKEDQEKNREVIKNLNINIKKAEKEKEKEKQEKKKLEITIQEKNREIDKVNHERKRVEDDYDLAVNEIKSLNAQIDSYKKKLDEISKIKDKIEHQKKEKEREVEKKVGELDGLRIQINNNEGDLKTKKEAFDNLKKDLDKMYKMNAELERARDKVVEENTKLKNKIDHMIEDIRLKENRIQELQKKLNENEKKIKMQQDLYDAVRRDKNLYFKNLIETQDDLVARKNQLKTNTYEIEQLKTELKRKDTQITTFKQDISSLKNKYLNQKEEKEKFEKKSENLKENVSSLEKEIENLKNTVFETKKEFKNLQKTFKATKVDRDNLSSQLIRRNDEVSLLYEKIKILTTTLSRGEIDFQKLVNEINLKTRENRTLARELDISKHYKEDASKYGREVIKLHKELLHEKNLNKALVEEVENSERVFHRWGKLEGIDPDSLEMHYKINLLQKRLISKTEECVGKEIIIQDLTKELADCKKGAAKKPEMEIEESIRTYKKALKEKTQQMKAIAGERNMFEGQILELKNENEKVRRDLKDFQIKYYELKNRQAVK